MQEKYTVAMRALHWLMALCIIGLLAVGFYMEGLPREAPGRMDLYNLHKSFGVTVLFLLLLRMAVRLASRVPPLPAGLHAWEKHAAEATHAAFYVLLCLMPLSGLVMSNAYGYGVKWFGYELPRLVEANRPLAEQAGEAHEIIAWVLLAFLAAHIAGVIKHRLVDKQDILQRMRW